ncbi:MAG: GGDEF domain-containing protein [Lachnotalea sp.]
MIKNLLPNSKYINYFPILQMSAICMVIAGTHFVFSLTLCLLCFPMFTTILFGDKHMTKTIGLVSLVFMVFDLLNRRFSVYRLSNDKYFFAEAIVALAFFCGTYILCTVLIRFSNEKNDIIHHGYLQRIEMQEQLNRDQKTNLYGHTSFMNTLELMVLKSNKTLELFTVAVIDIDDFKKVNDTYGHLKGDQVIIMLADLMRKCFNHNHFIARYGGEEFAVIFSNDELGQVWELLENLRIMFEAQKYNFMEDTITISIGFASWRQGWTAEQIFEAADKAMYTSKSEGKNRTKIYEGS